MIDALLASGLPDLAVAAILAAVPALPALALAYGPRRRPPAPRPDTYRGTVVEWPRPPLRPHPRFERPYR